MKPEFETIQQFIQSLSLKQRRFFIGREADIQKRLQLSLRDLGRGLGEVSGLNGEALAIVMTAAVNLPRPKLPGER